MVLGFNRTCYEWMTVALMIHNLTYKAFILSTTLNNLFFSISGGALTKRLRIQSLQCMLNQDVAWFDCEENHAGASSLRWIMAGIPIGVIIECISTFGIGLAFGFFFSWQLTLVVCAVIMIFLAIGLIEFYRRKRIHEKTKTVFSQAAVLATESIQNIRIVIQLTKEDNFIQKYSSLIDQASKISIKHNYIGAFAYGLVLSQSYFSLAICYYTAVKLTQRHLINAEQIIMVTAFIMFTKQIFSNVFPL
ncbi:unnamed protein product [Didymodactylos carnosus]|uniref:ABC transmembrane type-1 domain-containing protein n=1 Tax=Didymodactylos carnosus TaxID=1234261 RepID=A0A8S2PJA8_9BILA|nr:unnamed protein product [Didymodactylos carnosus]CAF4051347.1 unnamed protein product [Didymodactylos carnosus]